MAADEMQLRRTHIVGTLVVFIVGGALLAATMLPTFVALPSLPEQSPPDAVPAVFKEEVNGLTAAHPTTPPLPTIPVPTTILAPESSAGSAGSLPGAAPAAAQIYQLSGSDLAAYLAAQLTCLQPAARHDQDLDAGAAELARQDTTPLPTQGTIHITSPDEHHILLGPDAVADMRLAHGRCGETLIFGMPPLGWLPASARFGIGVDQRLDGVVIVVVIR